MNQSVLKWSTMCSLGNLIESRIGSMPEESESTFEQITAARSNTISAAQSTLTEIEQHFVEMVSGVEDHAIFLLDPTGRVLSGNAGAQ